MLESSVNFESIMISTVSKLLSRREERLKWIAATKFKIENRFAKFKIQNPKSKITLQEEGEVEWVAGCNAGERRG